MRLSAKIGPVVIACILAHMPFFAQAASDQVFSLQNNQLKNSYQHNIQLQLSDGNGVPVSGTKFWVTLTILKEGPKVTIQLPLINFVTGPYAHASFESPPVLSGGYLSTADGFLPRHLRPTDIVYRSWLAASNNGVSASYSFNQNPNSYPVPPAGYIISITNAGALVVQGPASTGNIIPPGAQILLPTDISYLVQPRVRLQKNKKISKGATNITRFAIKAENDGIRDTHINDAFDGVAAWSWTDNSMIHDKTNNTLNAMVAIGRVKDNGELEVGKPIQLTKLPKGVEAWDTAVAINRKNKNNIVVSYGVIDHVHGGAKTYRAVSFNRGKTWHKRGPTNIQPTGSTQSFGDYRGVASDKYGNIWLLATNATNGSGTLINQPYFAVSTDGGVTFRLVYTLPLMSNTLLYDFPQFCFGGDGRGHYGLHFTADHFNTQDDEAPVVGFIPIFGHGSFGTPKTPVYLSSFLNNNYFPSITASKDGRVWFLGLPLPLGSSIGPICTVFKSPGSLKKNYAGPWNYGYANFLNITFEAPISASEPIRGYIYNCAQANIYDDKRGALYQIMASQSRDFSQNMNLNFSISRDNGQTWSNPIRISNTDFGNRGFQSMALDTVRGDLYFGWYDGRHDSTCKSVEYYGGVIPAKKLSNLVKKIPYSNPKYKLGSAGTPITD